MLAQDVCHVCLHVTHFRYQSLPIEDIPQGQTFFLTFFFFLSEPPESLKGESVVASGLAGLIIVPVLVFRGLDLRLSERPGEFSLSLLRESLFF